MIYGLYLILVCLAINALALALPAPCLRWAQGWLIPHETPQPFCRVDCATCRR